MTQSDGEDGEDDPQSAMLNEYYATLTAQQQKLLQAKTPAFVRQKSPQVNEEGKACSSSNFL